MDDQTAISLLAQQIEATRVEMNRALDALAEQVAALGPPDDDDRQRKLRRRKSWKGFLSDGR